MNMAGNPGVKHLMSSRAWPVLAATALMLQGAEPDFAARYERLYREAQAAFEKEPGSGRAAWEFARACFDRAEFSTNAPQRAATAQQGIAAAREAVRLAPANAAAHYYLGMNLGQLAQTRSLGALKLVSEMERAFKTARDLDARFDFAGPDRCLGLLYRDAPGWPVSVGSRSKARQHLQRARELAPDYPENQLNLLETWLKWGDTNKVVADLKKVEEVLATARKRLVGEAWAWAWADWEKRWRKLQTIK